jgi:hypothetical protein
MRDRNLDLVAAVLIAFASALAAALRLHGPLVVVLGVVLLAATGYVAGEAILGSAATSLDGLALTAAFVLGVPAVGGVLLNADGLPLTRLAWATLFVIVTVVAAGIAGRRREAGTVPQPSSREEGRWDGPAEETVVTGAAHARPRRGPGHRLLLGTAVVVAAAAVWLAVGGANAQRYPGFTELSLVSHADIAVVGVRNFEGHRQHYLVTVRRNDSVPLRFRLDLRPGATWTRTIPRPNGAELRADLYTSNKIEEKSYRTVILTRTE